MKINELKWESKDCCGLHQCAKLALADGNILQIDPFDEDRYQVSVLNRDGGNIAHELVPDSISVLSRGELQLLLDSAAG